MTRVDQADLSRLSDGQLWLRRATYERETAWAPRWCGGELKLAHGALLNAKGQVALAVAEAEVARRAGDHAAARRHEGIAESGRAAEALLVQIVDSDTLLMADRQEWSDRTGGSRLLAVQADAVLRRRHPEARIEPLRSAEPDPAPEELPELTPEAVQEHLRQAAERRQRFARQLEKRLNVAVPAEDPDLEPEGEAWPSWSGAERDAVLQPPRPLIPARQREPELQHTESEAG
jgi:hypothetical protein